MATRANVQAGYYDATGFHPLRRSRDYDPDRLDDDSTGSARTDGAGLKRRTRGTVVPIRKAKRKPKSKSKRNGRSFVRKGERVPSWHTPKAGEVWYLSGRKGVIKRVGTDNGTPYVWFVRPVDGTVAMSVGNLIQAGYLEKPPTVRNGLRPAKGTESPRVRKALTKYVRANAKNPAEDFETEDAGGGYVLMRQYGSWYPMRKTPQGNLAFLNGPSDKHDGTKTKARAIIEDRRRNEPPPRQRRGRNPGKQKWVWPFRRSKKNLERVSGDWGILHDVGFSGSKLYEAGTIDSQSRFSRARGSDLFYKRADAIKYIKANAPQANPGKQARRMRAKTEAKYRAEGMGRYKGPKGMARYDYKTTSSIQRGRTMKRPSEQKYLTRNPNTWTITAIKRANREAGGHFFDKNSVHFFASKTDTKVYSGSNGVFFVDSSQFVNSAGIRHPRVYKVCQFMPESGRVTHVGGSQHASVTSARDEAKIRAGATRSNPGKAKRAARAKSDKTWREMGLRSLKDARKSMPRYLQHQKQRVARIKAKALPNPSATPGTKIYEVRVPATSYDAGYTLTIRAKSKRTARAEAKSYCADTYARKTGNTKASYKLPSKTKVTEVR